MHEGKPVPFALSSPLELRTALSTEQVCKLEKNSRNIVSWFRVTIMVIAFILNEIQV